MERSKIGRKSIIKEEMELNAQRGELEYMGISRNAIFDEEGNLFLDMF